MKPQHVKVLLADDHDVVRTGVSAILRAREGWEVCAEATNGIEAVKLAAEVHPDVVILDFEMGELDGLAATRQIKEHQPEIEVVIFTMHDNEYLIRVMLSAGARAFVLKSEGGKALVKAVEYATRHKPFLSARVCNALLNSVQMATQEDGEPRLLTDREKQVVQFLTSGRSNKETARALGISVKTVETHRASIMRKLGFTSIATLVRYAVRESLIKA